MTARGRLATAALASLALHALVMAGAWLPVPRLAEPPASLEARLAAVPPVAKPEPEIAPAPRVRQKRPTASAAVDPAPAPAPAPIAPAAAPGPPFLAEREPEAALPEPPAPAPPQRVALAAETSAVVATMRTLPRRGRITYNFLYGDQRAHVGKVVQSWEAEADRYRIASEAETSGLVDLFQPQRIRYMSRGRITAQGLQPESFLRSRTRRGQNEASQANFDWSAGHLTYGNAAELKQVALPASAQDLMSFMLQFSLIPPVPGRHQLAIATGPRFEVYDIEVGGEQSIETPIGTLRALPVRQLPRAGSESIEVWLAAEYRYLPVKVRYFSREGSLAGEQLVSEIRISED